MHALYIRHVLCSDFPLVRVCFCKVIRKTPEEMEPGGSNQHEAQLLAVAADPGALNLASSIPSNSSTLQMVGCVKAHEVTLSSHTAPSLRGC
jgi:hypothetical protein